MEYDSSTHCIICINRVISSVFYALFSSYSRRLLSKLATSVDAWSLIFYSDKRFSIIFHLYRFDSIDLFNRQHDRIILAEYPLFCHGIGVRVSFVRKAKVFCPRRECFPEVLARLRNTCWQPRTPTTWSVCSTHRERCTSHANPRSILRTRPTGKRWKCPNQLPPEPRPLIRDKSWTTLCCVSRAVAASLWIGGNKECRELVDCICNGNNIYQM